MAKTSFNKARRHYNLDSDFRSDRKFQKDPHWNDWYKYAPIFESIKDLKDKIRLDERSDDSRKYNTHKRGKSIGLQRKAS